MSDNKLIITPDTKIVDMVNAYPNIENVLIELAPAFEKLRNPVLFKTVAKVTNLKQASIVGKVELGTLINALRKFAGQDEIKIESDMNKNSAKPEWVGNSKIAVEYDARIDLANGQHPVGKVVGEVTKLAAGQIYKLVTPFVPTPLIDKVEEKGFNSYSEQINDNEVYTYFIKK